MKCLLPSTTTTTTTTVGQYNNSLGIYGGIVGRGAGMGGAGRRGLNCIEPALGWLSLQKVKNSWYMVCKYLVHGNYIMLNVIKEKTTNSG